MASRTRRKTKSGGGYRNWNQAEEKALYEYSIQGYSDDIISTMMGRSRSAIANRRFSMRENGEWDQLPGPEHKGGKANEHHKNTKM